jgi:hypothetical protein
MQKDDSACKQPVDVLLQIVSQEVTRDVVWLLAGKMI